MEGIWPAALANVSESVARKRFAILQQSLIERARPGTFFYLMLGAFYVPLVIDRPVDLAATITVTALLFCIGCARAAFYRATPRLTISPDRWRTYFSLGAGAMICCWDTFAAFQIWHRNLDAACVILVAASLAFRASGTYTASPDLRIHRVFAGPTRIAILVAPVMTGTAVGVVLSSVLLIHTLYTHVHGKQLNAEFWRNVASAEAAQAAHEKLQHEVAMRERAEVELRLAQKLESVGRLAAGIAHEINTPLQAMTSNIGFLQDGVAELLEMVQPSADRASDLEFLRTNLPSAIGDTQTCLARTAAIVRSVRTFAHPDSTQKTPVDINHALLNTLEISRHEYAMVADVKTELGEVPILECHAGELNQALLNLVINAAHAIDEVHARTRERGLITVATSVAGDALRIAISDTGGGIPASIRERIFDPFFTTKAVGRGTGQGLAVVRSVIAKHHGGELRLDTEVGRGTTFEILLPLGAEARAA